MNPGDAGFLFFTNNSSQLLFFFCTTPDNAGGTNSIRHLFQYQFNPNDNFGLKYYSKWFYFVFLTEFVNHPMHKSKSVVCVLTDHKP